MEHNLKKTVVWSTVSLIIMAIMLKFITNNIAISLIPLGIGYVVNCFSYIYYKLNSGGTK